MKALEWIERVKTAAQIESDYGVAKALGLSRQSMSDIRKGRTVTLGEESSIRVAQVLGERPEAVILDQAAERVKAPEIRSALFDAARRLCILCSIVVAPPQPKRRAASRPKSHPLNNVWHAMA